MWSHMKVRLYEIFLIKKNALCTKVLIKDIICTIGEGAVKPGDGGGGRGGGVVDFLVPKNAVK